MSRQKHRFIFSAGGTGGHIFPALATADALRTLIPDAEILFIGAEKRMEMEKVPHHGYPIIGLPIRGLQRKLTLRNLSVPFRLLKSLCKANRIIKDFKPTVVAGFGGYASGPVMRKAASKGIPTLLQEQNSFPGLTNRILSRKVNVICVAYPGMEHFFDASKICFTGNPVRNEICEKKISREDAIRFFGLDPSKKTILALGGSLGARTINETICSMIPTLVEQDIQLIWQTGKHYAAQACEFLYQNPTRLVVAQEFIFEMPQAYAAADVVVSRAGAIAVSEIAVSGKPAVFVPSPNVADDHQTKNARTLADRNAALMVADADARQKLAPVVMELLHDEKLQTSLTDNLASLAMPEAAMSIAKKILELSQIRKNGNH